MDYRQEAIGVNPRDIQDIRRKEEIHETKGTLPLMPDG